MKKSYLVLLSLIGLIFVGSWIHHWWTGRGLITLNVKDAPVTKVLREMQRQSGFSVLARTNLNEKVTVQFQRVTIEKALDAVSDQTEGRWQKVLLVARDKPALRKVESQVAEKGPPFIITGMDSISDSLDPEKLRKGPVKPLAGSHPLQEAALAVAVRSATPVVVQEGLNPFVKASATSYPGIAPAVGDLAHAASARWEVAYHFRAGGRGFGVEEAGVRAPVETVAGEAREEAKVEGFACSGEATRETRTTRSSSRRPCSLPSSRPRWKRPAPRCSSAWPSSRQ